MIENYPNLEKLYLNNNSLRYANSLKICNCEKLKTIVVDGGKGPFGINTDNPFENMNDLSFESMLAYNLLIFRSSQSTITRYWKSLF